MKTNICAIVTISLIPNRVHILHIGEVNDIDNNTWARKDMEYLFECSTRYLSTERSGQVRYRVELEQRNSISPSIMYYFVYFMNTLLKRSRLNSRFKRRTRCHSFIVLNRASHMSAGDWRSQRHVTRKILIFHVTQCGCSWWWKSLQFM